MSIPTSHHRYKLSFTVPHPHLSACKEAIFAEGAGAIPGGKYSQVCFEIPGLMQYRPDEGAVPNIGTVGSVEKVGEMKVEVLCVGRELMLRVVEALKRAHPYEEVAYDVCKLEEV